METKENNIVHLIDHINSKQEIETFNSSDTGYFDISKDKITQRKIYSFIVDMSVIMLINTAVHVSYSLFIKNFMYLLNLDQKSNLMATNLPVQLSVFMLIYTSYFFYSMYTLEGQTFGKMVFKIKTIQDEYIFEESNQEYSPSLSQAWRRTFGYLTCYLSFGTFFFFSFMSEDKRGLPDYFSQTRTVSNEWLAGMKAHRHNDHHEVQIDITALDKVA